MGMSFDMYNRNSNITPPLPHSTTNNSANSNNNSIYNSNNNIGSKGGVGSGSGSGSVPGSESGMGSPVGSTKSDIGSSSSSVPGGGTSLHRRSHTATGTGSGSGSGSGSNHIQYNTNTPNQSQHQPPSHCPTNGLCCHVEVHNNFNVSDMSEMDNIEEGCDPNVWLHVSTIVTDECNFGTG